MKTMSINGYEIDGNSCNGMTIRVFDKYMGFYLSAPFSKDKNNLSVNQIKVMELINSADSVEVSKDEDGKTYLTLHNEHYKIVVDIPEVKA